MVGSRDGLERLAVQVPLETLSLIVHYACLYNQMLICTILGHAEFILIHVVRFLQSRP